MKISNLIPLASLLCTLLQWRSHPDQSFCTTETLQPLQREVVMGSRICVRFSIWSGELNCCYSGWKSKKLITKKKERGQITHNLIIRSGGVWISRTVFNSKFLVVVVWEENMEFADVCHWYESETEESVRVLVGGLKLWVLFLRISPC